MQLRIQKWPEPGDPTPGEEFSYFVDWCNDRGAAVGPVWLTDTLPSELTLLAWYPRDRENFWLQESFSPQELVLRAPGLPGDFIDNTAVISSPSDLETDDNQAIWEGWINEPHVNIGVNKYWNWGQLVAGGQISYGIRLYNDGNTPVNSTIRLTDTLPAHTSFDSAWRHDDQGSIPWIPVEITADYVVWEINGLQNGFNHDWEVILNIDNAAPSGADLVNTASVTLLPDEDNDEDNESIWLETLNPPGPNLRVRKHGEWDGHDPNSRHANYWISLENIGNTRVDGVMISDNYPADMTMDEGFDTEWWRLTDFQHDPGNQQFTAVYDYLYPGETTWFNFGAQIPGSNPLPPDQTYVNSVEVTAVPDETNTADNLDTAVLHSCMTPLEVTDLTLHIDGEDVVFNWSDIGADYYQIWWSDTNPYVEADPQCEPGIDSCEYTDGPDNHRRVGGASDPNANGYYRLIARNHCGIDNATDYTVGLFRFAIQAGD